MPGVVGAPYSACPRICELIDGAQVAEQVAGADQTTREAAVLTKAFAPRVDAGARSTGSRIPRPAVA